MDAVRRSSRIDIFRTDSCGKFSQVPGFFVAGLVRENAFVGTPEVGFSHFCGRFTHLRVAERAAHTRRDKVTCLYVSCLLFSFLKFAEQLSPPLLIYIFLRFFRFFFLLLFFFSTFEVEGKGTALRAFFLLTASKLR